MSRVEPASNDLVQPANYWWYFLVTAASADLMAALTVTQIFDSIAVRVDGPRAWDHHITIS